MGGLTGAVTLVAMARLIVGGLGSSGNPTAWVVVLAALLPWVVYLALRARRSLLARNQLRLAGALSLAGLAVVWIFTVGPVAALLLSGVAAAVIWVGALPPRRAGEARLVRMEELQFDEPASDGEI